MIFGIITISYGRPKVLKLFLASIKRLRTELNLNFPCVVVGDAEHFELCEAYDVVHIAHENHPASRKWNMGVDYMTNLGVTYVMVTGSDDIIATNLATNLIARMEEGHDLIGISSIYFYAADGKFKGNLRKLMAQKQILGVCRCIHRRVIEKAKPLWKRDRSWAMDGDCLRSILPYVKTHAIVDGVCVDIKTHENLNKFSFWASKLDGMCPPEIFYQIMGEEEKQILNEI